MEKINGLQIDTNDELDFSRCTNSNVAPFKKVLQTIVDCMATEGAFFSML